MPALSLPRGSVLWIEAKDLLAAEKKVKSFSLFSLFTAAAYVRRRAASMFMAISASVIFCILMFN